MHLLSGWENFYVITGSSAGALIGLQFVVMTLIADIPMRQDVAAAGNAFATPTIIHFSAVLLLAGVMATPWQSLHPVAVIWGIMGFVGLVYCGITTRRVKSQQAYKPEFEDWLFHSLLPFAAYAILAGSGVEALVHERGTLFAVQPLRCCCFSSAFTTHGTPLPTTSLYAVIKRRTSSNFLLLSPSAVANAFRQLDQRVEVIFHLHIKIFLQLSDFADQ